MQKLLNLVMAFQRLQACVPLEVAKLSTSFGWGESGNVTSVGWQVTLCDPIRLMSSRNGETTYKLLYSIPLSLHVLKVSRSKQCNWALNRSNFDVNLQLSKQW